MLVRVNILAAGILLLFLSCQSEKKLGQEYVNQSSKPALYMTMANEWQVMFHLPQGTSPNETFARRYFPYRIYDLKNKGTARVDSIFQSSMINRLKAKQFSIFNDTMADAFLAEKGEKYIIEFLQLWIEETGQPYHDTLFLSEDNYASFDTVTTRYDISLWLRINPVDDSLLAAPVLYASFSMSDFMQGSWTYNLSNDQYSYEYIHEALTFDDALTFAGIAGNRLAGYIYDYFLNIYIFKRLSKKPEAYYTWSGRFLKPAGIERFVFMP